jgi:outer membrane lipoprotein-sorting protein
VVLCEPQRRQILTIAVLMLLSSCSPKPSEILLDTKAIDAGTLIALARERQNKLQSVVGRGTVSFESPEIAGSAAFELALKRPDSLLVTFEGPFGIDLGTLFISPEKYVLYNSMENRVITGVPTGSTLRSFIPFDLTLDQVIGAFSGSFPFPSDLQSLRTFSIEDGMFLLTFTSGRNLRRYWVDNRDILVKKYEIRNEQDQLIMDATASSFAEDGQAHAPKRIRIRFPEQDRQLSVSYSSMTLNDPNPSFAYTIPPNARTTTR